jgi:long-chain acyl-CoA synthetase
MTRLDAIAVRGARRAPDRAAIVVPPGAGPGDARGAAGAASISHAELDRAAGAFARSLRARGASPGDRLVLANPNTIGFFVALFGAARAGLVAVPLDPGLAAAELRNLLDHARPHAAVVDARSAAVFEPLGVPLCTVPAAPADDDRGSDDRADPRGPDEPAVLLYTSGTTGTPRGAVHSHAGILRKVEDIRTWFGLGDADRELCMLPTHFGHGWYARASPRSTSAAPWCCAARSTPRSCRACSASPSSTASPRSRPCRRSSG